MSINRRAFLAGASVASTFAHSANSAAASKSGEFEAIRGEFPRAVEQVYLDAAAKLGETHTYSVITVNGVGLKSEPSAQTR